MAFQLKTLLLHVALDYEPQQQIPHLFENVDYAALTQNALYSLDWRRQIGV